MPTTRRRPAAARAAAAALAAALVLGLPALAPAAPPVEDDFRFYRPDADVVFVVHMDKLVASEPAQKLRKDLKDFDKAMDEVRRGFGVAAADIERLSGGGRIQKDEGLFVVRTKKAVKAADIAAAMKEPRFEGDKGVTFKEVKVGKHTLYQPEPDARNSFCVLDDRTVLYGRSKDLQAALGRDGKAEPPAGLKKALEQADRNATVYFAADLKAIKADNPDALPPDFPGGFSPRKALADADGLAGSMTAGPEVTFRVAAVCKDAKSAAALKEEADKGLAALGTHLKGLPKVPKEIAALPGMAQTAAEGNVAKGTLTVKSDVAVLAFRALFEPGPAPPPQSPR
jgi:hypothetical protein